MHAAVRSTTGVVLLTAACMARRLYLYFVRQVRKGLPLLGHLGLMVYVLVGFRVRVREVDAEFHSRETSADDGVSVRIVTHVL